MPRIIFRPHPLKPDSEVYADFPPGQSIADMIGQTSKRLHLEMDGEPIPPDKWALTVPHECAVIRVHPVPGYELIAIIGYWIAYAVAYAAAYIGISVGVAAVIGMVVAYGVLAGLAIGISMALNAVLKPQDQKGKSSATDDRYSALSGAQNTANPFSPIPKLYGTWRMIPPKGGETYTEVQANDQYLHVLLCLGYGPMQIGGHIVGTGYPKIGRISDGDGGWDINTALPPDTIRIGDTSLTKGGGTAYNFQGVQWEICGPEALSLYTNDVAEQTMAVEFKHIQPPGEEGGWFSDGQAVTRTTDEDASEISIDVAYQSMMSMGKNGEDHNVTVEWKVEYSPTGASTWTVVKNPWEHVGNSRGPKRFSLTFFAKVGGVVTPGRYDVRLTRIRTYVADRDVLQCDAYWIALRSVRRIQPWNYDTATGGVPNVVMLAMKIKATGQVNGQLDPVSVLGTSVLRVWNGTAWSLQPTAHPAWCFVDALTGPQLKKPLTDDKLDLPTLLEWATDVDRGFNWYYLSEETIFNRFRTIAKQGRAEWTMIGEKFSVIRENNFTPTFHICPRNAWGFRFEKKFPEFPHALRVKYVDPVTYQEAERIVLDDGYQLNGKDAFGNAAPGLPLATDFSILETHGCTSADEAFKDGRYFLAAYRHRTETYWVEQDFEALVVQRGDCGTQSYDVILVGLGSGRIKAVQTNVAGQALAITTDETWTIEAGITYGVLIRRSDGTQSTVQASAAVGETNTLNIAGYLTGVAAGDLVTFGVAGSESLLVKVTEVEYRSDMSAQITLTPAAPEILGAETGTIPEWDPKVTIPAHLRLPSTPLIIGVSQSRETIRANESGQWIGAAVVAWTLPFSPVTVDGFEVMYDTPNADPVSLYFLGGSNLSATLPAIPAGALVTIYVRARSIYGRWGQYSDPATITLEVIDLVAEPPANLALDTQVTVRLDGAVDYNILADWDAPSAGMVDHYEAEWKRSADTQWSGQNVSRGTTEYVIRALFEGQGYDVRVRTVNAIGTPSEWISESVTVAVKNTPPGAPSGLAATGEQTGVTLRWTNPSDNDLAVIEVWESASNDRATAVLLSRLAGTSLFRSLPDVAPRYYWVRAEDTSGNQSTWHPAGQYAGVAGNAGGLDGALIQAGSIITAALADSAVTIAKLADEAVSATKFAAGIQPVGIVDSLPSPVGYTGPNTVFLTTNGKLYRYSGGAWTAAVAAADVSGQLTNAQIADLAATKITGQLTSAQIADLAAAKLTGEITSTQITDGAVSTPKLAAGAVTTAKISANAVTANEIAADSIIAAKIAAGAVTTAKIAADAVTANEIAAGAITATELAAGSVTTSKIAAGAITANELAADSVTAGKVAAGAISTSQLAAGAVTTAILGAGAVSAEKIAAGSIDSSKLVSGEIITESAQIRDGIILNAKIGNAEIGTLKVAGQAITVNRSAGGGPNSFALNGGMYLAGICTIWIDSVPSGARGLLNIIMLGTAYVGHASGQSFDWMYSIDGGPFNGIYYFGGAGNQGDIVTVTGQTQISLDENFHYIDFYIWSDKIHASSWGRGGITILECKR